MTCAIYCRLSREDEEKARESESIQNQKSMLVRYAVQQGWEIYRIYCDEDYSGVDRERPDWNAMLQAAQGGRFQIILCKTQSRFTRDMELVEKYLHGLFPLWGIRFVAVVDNIDTDQRGNKKARQISGLINEWYLEDLSENIRAVFDQKRSAGQYIGSFPVYGYQKDPADHNRLVVDPPAAEVVRMIYRLSLQGAGKQRIASLLNEQGILNPTLYKQSKGWNYRGGCAETGSGLWNRTTVGRILRNEMYTGTMVQGTRRKVSYKSKACVEVPQDQWYRVAGTHEAIIGQDDFDMVQRLLDRRTRSSGTGQVHPLAGKARCADCGGPLIKVSQLYHGERRSYLQCKLYASSRADPRCTRHSVRLDALTDAVRQRIRAHLDAYYRLGDPARLFPKTGLPSPFQAAKRELQALQGQLSRRSQALRSLYLDKAEGLIGPAQFDELNRRFLEERERLQSRIDRLEQAQRPDSQAPPPSPQARVERLLELDPMPRALAGLLIESVTVGEKRPDGTQDLHIEWRF